MPRSLRPRRPGVPIFFTVALAGRGGRVLVDQIGLLRMAVAQTRAERPFVIDAWVVLPDHLQCIWRLPEGDTDHATRWGTIKARFTRAVKAEVGWNLTLGSASKIAKGMQGRGSGGFTNITPRMKPITRRICALVGSTR